MSRTKPLRISASDAPVRHVTVYLDRAEIHREWSQELDAPGSYELAIHSVPGEFDVKSVRVALIGPGSIRNVRTEECESENTENQTLEKLNETLVGLRKDETALKSKSRRCIKQLQVWDQFIDSFSKNINVGNASNQSVDASANFAQVLKSYEAECKKIDKDLQKQREELRKLAGEISSTEKEAEVLKSIREIKMLLTVESPSEFVLKISYTIKNAQWHPKYDIRMINDKAQIQVDYHGAVRQSTGEEWKNVELTLATVPPITFAQAAERLTAGSNNQTTQSPTVSTSTPATDIPKFDSFGLGQKTLEKAATQFSFDVKNNKSIFYDATAVEPNLFSMEVGGTLISSGSTLSPQNISSSPNAVTVPENPSSNLANHVQPIYEILKEQHLTPPTKPQKRSFPLLFLLPNSVTVPGDNSEISFLCTTFTISDVKMRHHCVPNVSLHVYAFVRGLNTSAFALLPGVANVYLDDTYITTKHLQAVASLEWLELWLGPDPDVLVRHKVPQRTELNQNVLGEQKLETVKYEFVIQNNRAQQIVVSATWDLTKNSTSGCYTMFIDAPSLAPAPGGSRTLKKGFLNPAMTEVNWSIQIPAGGTHSAPLVLKIDRPVYEFDDFANFLTTESVVAPLAGVNNANGKVSRSNSETSLNSSAPSLSETVADKQQTESSGSIRPYKFNLFRGRNKQKDPK